MKHSRIFKNYIITQIDEWKEQQNEQYKEEEE